MHHKIKHISTVEPTSQRRLLQLFQLRRVDQEEKGDKAQVTGRKTTTTPTDSY